MIDTCDKCGGDETIIHILFGLLDYEILCEKCYHDILGIKTTKTRMHRLKEAGLIGCFDDTGVNSTNYKEIMLGKGV